MLVVVNNRVAGGDQKSKVRVLCISIFALLAGGSIAGDTGAACVSINNSVWQDTGGGLKASLGSD